MIFKRNRQAPFDIKRRLLLLRKENITDAEYITYSNGYFSFYK